MTEIENRYNEEKGLVRAEQSTSNDAFPNRKMPVIPWAVNAIT